MIQVHVFWLPLGIVEAAKAVIGIRDAHEKIARMHPSLLGVDMDQLDPQVIGQSAIELRLRVCGHNRWRVQHNARLIAAVLARRAGLPYMEALHVRVESEPSARHLTGEQGREFSHASRGPAVQEAVS